MPEDAFIDELAIARLHRVGGDQLVRGMIEIFLRNAPQKLETAFQAEKKGDLKTIEQAVHSLKSSAGNLGAVVVKDLAGQIEALAENGEWTGVSQRLRELRAACDRAETWLKAKTGSGSKPDDK